MTRCIFACSLSNTKKFWRWNLPCVFLRRNGTPDFSIHFASFYLALCFVNYVIIYALFLQLQLSQMASKYTNPGLSRGTTSDLAGFSSFSGPLP
jgi:hypothetical protein